MGLVVKDASQAAAKYVQRAGAAGPDYEAGVKGAGERWASGAAGAEEVWAQGVNQAVARKAYGKGVAEAGSAKYVKNATVLGPGRYTQGVQNAQGAWQAGVQPSLDVMRNITLPPRAPRGSVNNYMRSQVLGQALRQRKVGSTAA